MNIIYGANAIHGRSLIFGAAQMRIVFEHRINVSFV